MADASEAPTAVDPSVCASNEACALPKFFIHAINSAFRSRDDGREYERPEDALGRAIESAAALAVDELHKGKTSAAIEVRIEQMDGTPLLRSVVSLSVAPLLPLIEVPRPTA